MPTDEDIQEQAVATPKLSDCLKMTHAAVGETVAFFASIEKDDLPTTLRAFKALDECKKALDIITEQIHKLHQDLSYEQIPDMMETLGFDSVKAANRTFTLAVRINASIPKDMQPKGFEWLRTEGASPDLITETVNARTISAFVKDYFQTYGKYPPEDCIKVHQQRYIQMRKT